MTTEEKKNGKRRTIFVQWRRKTEKEKEENVRRRKSVDGQLILLAKQNFLLHTQPLFLEGAEEKLQSFDAS